MARITRDDQQMVFLQVRALSIDFHIAMAANAEHQVVLARALRALPIMMACLRKPANVRRVDSTHQRVLSRTAENRAGDDKHVLPGEAFAELDWPSQSRRSSYFTS